MARALDTRETGEFDILFERGRLGIDLAFNDSVEPSFAYVVAICAGTQAQYSPVKKGDKLMRVNGASCLGKTFDEVVEQLVNVEGRRRLSFQRVLVAVDAGSGTGPPTRTWTRAWTTTTTMTACLWSSC